MIGEAQSLAAIDRRDARPYRFLGVDPGARTGWCCIFADTGCILWSATTARGKLPQYGIPSLAAVEKPRSYPTPDKQAGPQQAIVKCALVAGEVAGMLRGMGAHVWMPEPRAWKGTIDKVRHHRQLALRLDCDACRAHWAKMSGHARDAYGLALYARRKWEEDNG